MLLQRDDCVVAVDKDLGSSLATIIPSVLDESPHMAFHYSNFSSSCLYLFPWSVVFIPTCKLSSGSNGLKEGSVTPWLLPLSSEPPGFPGL